MRVVWEGRTKRVWEGEDEDAVRIKTSNKTCSCVWTRSTGREGLCWNFKCFLAHYVCLGCGHSAFWTKIFAVLRLGLGQLKIGQPSKQQSLWLYRRTQGSKFRSIHLEQTLYQKTTAYSNLRPDFFQLGWSQMSYEIKAAWQRPFTPRAKDSLELGQPQLWKRTNFSSKLIALFCRSADCPPLLGHVPCHDVQPQLSCSQGEHWTMHWDLQNGEPK